MTTTPAQTRRVNSRHASSRRRLIHLIAISILAAFGLVTAVSQSAYAAPVTINNGVQNNDQNGNNVQGHGGTVIKVGSTYYWFGEDKKGENSSDAYFRAIPCYSSTDLAHWTYQSEALQIQPSGDLGPNRIVERPKVVYNPGTHMYVMYMHIDTPGYGTGKVGVADSPTVCGPYHYLGSFLPEGHQSWDIGLYQSPNGSAYLLSHGTGNLFYIYRLSSDYLSVTGQVAALNKDLEAPAMFMANGIYYFFGSNLTGWSSNDNVYATATSLSGPWSSWNTFAPVGSNTFNSQVDQILTLQGSSGTTYLYMGDRWNANDLGGSTYVWLPLSVHGTTVSMPTFYASFILDASAGTWSAGGSSATELVSAQSGKCLDDPDASQTNGTQFDIWTCHHGQNQEFTYTGGTLEVLGKCLDVYNQSTARGTKVEVWDCNGGQNQQWTINGNGTITANNTGLCLDVAGQNTANGAGIDVWTCNGQANQQWSKA